MPSQPRPFTALADGLDHRTGNRNGINLGPNSVVTLQGAGIADGFIHAEMVVVPFLFNDHIVDIPPEMDVGFTSLDLDEAIGVYQEAIVLAPVPEAEKPCAEDNCDDSAGANYMRACQ
jgi:hypothetical protein